MSILVAESWNKVQHVISIIGGCLLREASKSGFPFGFLSNQQVPSKSTTTQPPILQRPPMFDTHGSMSSFGLEDHGKAPARAWKVHAAVRPVQPTALSPQFPRIWRCEIRSRWPRRHPPVSPCTLAWFPWLCVIFGILFRSCSPFLLFFAGGGRVAQLPLC